MQTTQGTLDDVFNDATIEFTTDLPDSFGPNNNSQDLKINYLAEGVRLSSDGFEYEFSNTILYQTGGATFSISNGVAAFNPNFSFKSEYTFLGGLDYLDFRTNNANLSLNCEFSLVSTSGLSIPEFTTTLADFDKKFIILVAGIPVVIVVSTTLEAELTAGIEAQVSATAGFINNNTLTTSITYENDSWTGDFSLTPSISIIPFTMEGQVNFVQNLTITPRVSVKFYGIIGPYCQPEMTENLSVNVAFPSADWDAELKVGLEVTTGVDIEIFGQVVVDYNRVDSFEETIWNAPDKIERISGENQTGTQGQQLDEPLKVKVTDNLGNALSSVPVYFTVTHGEGTVDNQSVPTDENGFAEVFWILGNTEGEQQVEATVKKADGTTIENGTLNFVATDEFDYFQRVLNSHQINSFVENQPPSVSPIIFFDDNTCILYDLNGTWNLDGTSLNFQVSGNFDGHLDAWVFNSIYDEDSDSFIGTVDFYINNSYTLTYNALVE